MKGHKRAPQQKGSRQESQRGESAAVSKAGVKKPATMSRQEAGRLGAAARWSKDDSRGSQPQERQSKGRPPARAGKMAIHKGNVEASASAGAKKFAHSVGQRPQRQRQDEPMAPLKGGYEEMKPLEARGYGHLCSDPHCRWYAMELHYSRVSRRGERIYVQEIRSFPVSRAGAAELRAIQEAPMGHSGHPGRRGEPRMERPRQEFSSSEGPRDRGGRGYSTRKESAPYAQGGEQRSYSPQREGKDKAPERPAKGAPQRRTGAAPRSMSEDQRYTGATPRRMSEDQRRTGAAPRRMSEDQPRTGAAPRRTGTDQPRTSTEPRQTKQKSPFLTRRR